MTLESDERAKQAQTRRIRLLRSRRWLAIGILGLIGLLVACSDDGQAGSEQGSENAESSQEEAPAETAPPETAPPETDAPAPEEPGSSSDDSLSTEDWILLLAIGGVALVIIFGVTTVANRRSESKAAARAALNAGLGEIVGQSRWVHDSGSVEVLLATDLEQMQMAWRDVRTRMVDLEGRIATMAAGTGDQNLDRDLRNLGECVADLRSAEEGYVNTRTRAGRDQAALTETADQVVIDRRQQLRYAIEPVAAAMRA